MHEINLKNPKNKELILESWNESASGRPKNRPTKGFILFGGTQGFPVDPVSSSLC